MPHVASNAYRVGCRRGNLQRIARADAATNLGENQRRRPRFSLAWEKLVVDGADIRRDWIVQASGCDTRTVRRVNATFRGHYTPGFDLTRPPMGSATLGTMFDGGVRSLAQGAMDTLAYRRSSFASTAFSRFAPRQRTTVGSALIMRRFADV